MAPAVLAPSQQTPPEPAIPAKTEPKTPLEIEFEPQKAAQTTPPEDSSPAVSETAGDDVSVAPEPAARAQAVPTEAVSKPPEPKAALAAKPAPAPVGGGEPHREDWLLKQPAGHFSLQLLGSRSEKSIRDFIARHKLDPAQTAYYRGQHQGKPWYVLLYGSYPDAGNARTARAGLPAKVRAGKPWPRSFDSVHAAINETR